LEFLPLKLGKYECSVVVIDDDVGEMEYRVEASVTLPVHKSLPKLIAV